jgi:hypothetical protein
MFLICRKIYFAILLKFNREDAETLSMQKIFSRHYERSEVISKVLRHSTLRDCFGLKPSQ